MPTWRKESPMPIEPTERANPEPATAVPTSAEGRGAPASDPPTANQPPEAPDASDVVGGPVGSAWLKDPAAPGNRGADLEKLDSTTVASTD
jgi:hypothetical protein